MTILDEIQKQLRKLPPEKQDKVLEYVTSLQQRMDSEQAAKRGALNRHPAFGSWRKRKIDALNYEQTLRAEWDSRS